MCHCLKHYGMLYFRSMCTGITDKASFARNSNIFEEIDSNNRICMTCEVFVHYLATLYYNTKII